MPHYVSFIYLCLRWSSACQTYQQVYSFNSMKLKLLKVEENFLVDTTPKYQAQNAHERREAMIDGLLIWI